jgi:hypothetical protein
MCEVIDPPHDPRGGLYAPNITGGVVPNDSVSHIVSRLMNPDWSMWNARNRTHTLHITRAIGIVGNDHFHNFWRPGGLRRVLNQNDPVCVQLHEEVAAGRLNSKILDWLKGTEDTITLPESEFPSQEDAC